MAVKRQKPLTAEYEKDTAKGKRRYRIGESGDTVVGTIYVAADSPLADADTLNVTLAGVEEE
jgi:hypothetical protein